LGPFEFDMAILVKFPRQASYVLVFYPFDQAPIRDGATPVMRFAL